MYKAINKAKIEKVLAGGPADFINTGGIIPSLSGRTMAEYLIKLGYPVKRFYNAGTHGRIELRNGLTVSTNGYCHAEIMVY